MQAFAANHTLVSLNLSHTMLDNRAAAVYADWFPCIFRLDNDLGEVLYLCHS